MPLLHLHNGFSCTCGRDHRIPIKTIKITPGLLSNLVHELKELGAWERLLLVADENTWAVAGSDVYKGLKGQYRVDTVVFPGNPWLRPDELSISRVLDSTTHLPDLLLAVGSGTITDLVRHVAGNKLGIPFVSIPTAPSMDGYASTVSALSLGGFKVTVSAKPPLAILGDPDVLANAPPRLIAAGAADLLGKYTALMDWKIAREMDGEYYCPYVAELVRKAADECAENPEGLKMRSQDAVFSLMKGLILSGLGILMVGNSRPASGSEHHLSHFWEMKQQLSGGTERLHGEKVGVGSVLAAKAYRFLLEQAPDELCFDPKGRTLGLDFGEYISRLEKVFGPLTDQLLINRKKASGDDAMLPAGFEDRLLSALSCMASEGPSVENIQRSLSVAGAPTTWEELDLPEEWVRDGLLYGREVRDRYTIFTLLAQVGLLSRAAEEMVEEG